MDSRDSQCPQRGPGLTHMVKDEGAPWGEVAQCKYCNSQFTMDRLVMPPLGPVQDKSKQHESIYCQVPLCTERTYIGLYCKMHFTIRTQTMESHESEGHSQIIRECPLCERLAGIGAM